MEQRRVSPAVLNEVLGGGPGGASEATSGAVADHRHISESRCARHGSEELPI